MWWALGLTGGYALIEAVGGWWAGSLALLSDAGHMLTDAAALAVALFAQMISRRPPSEQHSYGFARAEVLGAFVNALFMLAIVVWITLQATQRLLDPQPVKGEPVIVIAIIGLLVNAFVAWKLFKTADSLNSRAALLHVLGDLLGSLAAIVSGVVVTFTGWTPADPLLSLVVVFLILRSTWSLLVQAIRVLMEAVPKHLSYEEIGRALAQVSGVISVHDLHVWYMSADQVALSAHLVLSDGTQWPTILKESQHVLATRFQINHVTLQPSWFPVQQAEHVILLSPKT